MALFVWVSTTIVYNTGPRGERGRLFVCLSSSVNLYMCGVQTEINVVSAGDKRRGGDYCRLDMLEKGELAVYLY